MCYTRHRRRATHIPGIMDYERHGVSVKCKNCSTCMHTILNDITMLSGIPSVFIHCMMHWYSHIYQCQWRDALLTSRAYCFGSSCVGRAIASQARGLMAEKSIGNAPDILDEQQVNIFPNVCVRLLGNYILLHVWHGRQRFQHQICVANAIFCLSPRPQGDWRREKWRTGRRIIAHCSTILYCIITGIRVC